MKININNVSAIIFFTTLLLVSVGIDNGNVKSLMLLALIIIVSIISIKKPAIGAIVLAGCIPLSGIIRWSDHGNLIAAGFVTVLIAALFSVISIRKAYNYEKLEISSKSHELILLPFICILLIHIFMASESLELLFAMVRNYLIPLLAYFIFVAAIETKQDITAKQDIVRKLIFGLYISATFVMIINLMHYFFGLNISLSKYVISNEGNIAFRNYGFGHFPRMNHIIGFGSQGSGGVFYGIFLMLSIYLIPGAPLLKKVMLVLAACLFLMSILLIASISGFVTLILGFGLMILIKYKKFLPILTAPSIMLFITTVFIIPIPAYDYSSIGSYAYYGFIHKFVVDIAAYPIYKIFLGNELGLAGGGLGYIMTTGFHDRWLFGALLQLGIIAFFSMVGWYSYIIYLAVKRYNFYGNNIGIVFSLIVFVAGLSYAHQAALMQPLFVYLLMMAGSIVCSFDKK